MGYSYNINRSKDQDQVLYYITERPFASIDASFWNGFIFLADYSFFNYRLGDTSLNKYDDLSMSIIFNKKESKWEFGIEATNVLENKSINRDNFSGIVQSTTSYIIQPRFTYLTIKYLL